MAGKKITYSSIRRLVSETISDGNWDNVKMGKRENRLSLRTLQVDRRYRAADFIPSRTVSGRSRRSP